LLLQADFQGVNKAETELSDNCRTTAKNAPKKNS
jgi:hypothetical protein